MMLPAPGTVGVTVRKRNVYPPPGLEPPATQSWPAACAAPVPLDLLSVRLDVEVAWPSGHREAVLLGLSPQSGARLTLSGSPLDAEQWMPLMLTGEQTILVPAANVDPGQRPPTNVLRTMCQHAWEDDPNADDNSVDGDSPSHANGDSARNGGSRDEDLQELLAVQGNSESNLCLTGFTLRARLNVTATVYLAPACAPPGHLDRRHTLLVSGTGTLELRPRILDYRKLGLMRLMAAAAEDSRRGEQEHALVKWRRALQIQEKRARFGGNREGAKLASLLHSMGVAYNLHGDAREALACLRRALAIRQHVLGEEHPESARTLQALGVVRVRDGEYHEAFEYFWQALRYYEAFEPDGLDAAGTLQAIAGVYGKLGEYSEALECYVRALTIRENELGKEHTEVAATLHNLGVVLEKLSDHSEALDSLHRALVIREKQLGPLHPQTARTLHSIGIVYSQLLDYSSALEFYQRALAICEKSPGEGTHAAATLNNMGVVYAKLGDTEAALQHHQQALAIQDRILGPNHCDTVATRYNLNVLETGMQEKANRSVFESVRQFFAAPFAPDPHAPSLVSLLCEESSEMDGPLDEPLCCAPGCSSHTKVFHQASGAQPLGFRSQDGEAEATLRHLVGLASLHLPARWTSGQDWTTGHTR